MNWNIVIEGVGIIGIVAAITAFQCKKHRNLMLFRTMNEFLFAIQYFLLGAYTGTAMNLIGCIRNMVFADMVEKKKNTIWTRVFFSSIILLFIVFTWDGPKSMLSGIAKTVSTFAYGSSRTSLVRVLTFCTSMAWLIYNVIVGSNAGVVCEALTLFSIIIGIIRIDICKCNKQAA